MTPERRLVILSLFTLPACATPADSSVATGSPPEAGASEAGGAPSGTGGRGPEFAPDAGAPPAGTGACSEVATRIYTVTRENVLFSFSPGTLTFTRVGALPCDARGATPFAMAVDRSATAWILYNDGSLFRVSTADASCAATGFARGQHGFLRFGMGFATDDDRTGRETLYVDDIGGGQGFGRVNLGAMTLTPVGDHTDGLSSYGADVTGTGDGRVFGFFTSTPATIAEFTKASGETPAARQWHLAGVATGTDWAFAFWGGDFWLFTASRGSSTDVTRFRPSDGSTQVVVRDVGFHVNGAGVSTCAPTAPPR